MSVLRSVASVVSGAALLVVLSGSVASADDPTSGPVSTPHESTCAPKPMRPDYPAQPRSLKCCPRPKVWQERYSGGLFGKPKVYVWVCQLPQTPPK